MHASYFSYNLSRPYPYVWFTPVVLVSGLIATALIAFLSVATQGYETISMATSNPNTTSDNRNPYSDWPSFLTANTKSLCSTTTIPIGTEFYTNNTALKYTVTKIWRGDNPKEPDALLGSLPYLNNPFQSCAVNGITIEFEGIDRSASQIALQQWGAKLRASLSCEVDTPGGRTTVNMTTTYDVNGIDNDVGTAFSGRNDTDKASLWWGESLLAWYSIALTNDMHVANEKFFRGENDKNVPPIYKGHISFTKRKTVVPSAQDIKALDFFQVSCFFVPFSNNGVSPNVYYCSHEKMKNSHLIEKLSKADDSDQLMPLPGIWISADSLAKAFYFTIHADLGQTDSGLNILDNVELLTHYTKDYEAIQNRTPIWGDNLRVNTTEGLAHRAFTSKDAPVKELGIKPSVISTTFLCQIPRLKSRPTLIVFVIINTIVILSALWRSYQFLIDAILSKNDPEMMNCAACIATTAKEVEYEAGYSSGQSSQSVGIPSRVKARYSSIQQDEDL
ncbi:hypothetical protein BFJ68_g3000 [Fusarium oxysporum]|uniref:Transmembrane protein n=1 Tax=Fusarium oxysporum TaxID=5507 RepID=A0A420QJ22_FUSOX|nr:hypothetical protein BFJ71_g3598 [Fusarium oxysporum]RKL20291.1 hypothetical protein BFJ68_g3000 [Fusarium oxysporum]